jgi:general secretion pathway protein L
MKALFFIEIPAHQHTEELSYSWYKKELNDESHGCNSLAEIKNISLNCDVVLVLPGLNITQKQIISKLKNRKKLELAIGYELEEVLAEEIDTLFFAYQAGKDKNSLAVAIVNRAWFEEWLEIFKQHAILLSAVISDVMLLETMPEDYLLIKKADYYLLKTPTASYAIDHENIGYFLTQLKDSLPEELTLSSDNEQELMIPEVPLRLTVVLPTNHLLKSLTEHYQLGNGINLLQGSYKPKLQNDWQRIKWATLGLFGLFMLATAFQAYQHWQLTQQETKLDQQRLKIFQDNFPAIKRIVSPLAQMKNELETLKQSQQQQSQFISLLAKVSIGLREMLAQGKAQLLELAFDGNILQLKLKTESLALVEQVKQNLTVQQLNVEVESSEKVENQVNASFKIMGNRE